MTFIPFVFITGVQGLRPDADDDRHGDQVDRMLLSLAR